MFMAYFVLLEPKNSSFHLQIALTCIYGNVINFACKTQQIYGRAEVQMNSSMTHYRAPNVAGLEPNDGKMPAEVVRGRSAPVCSTVLTALDALSIELWKLEESSNVETS